MPVWKLAIWSVVGFLIPVAIAWLVLPLLFPHSAAFTTASSPWTLSSVASWLPWGEPRQPEAVGAAAGQSGQAGLTDEQALTDKALREELSNAEMQGGGFIELPSYSSAQPDLAEDFMVTVKLTFDRLPNPGKRVRILMKTTERTPYQGWALGFKRQATSLRPEIFGRIALQKGGWLSFNDVALREGAEYTISMIVQEQKVVSVFVQVPETAGVEPVAAGPVLPTIGIPSYRVSDQAVGPATVFFAGGLDVAGLGSAVNDRQLIAVAPSMDKSGAIVRVRQVFLARLEKRFKNVPEALRFVATAPERLVDSVGADNVAIFVRDLAAARLQQAAKRLSATGNSLAAAEVPQPEMFRRGLQDS